MATSEKQTITYTLGFGSDFRDQFMFCHYMITVEFLYQFLMLMLNYNSVQAPQGKKIEVDIQSISDGYDWGGCVRGGVEIKAQSDQKLTGYR